MLSQYADGAEEQFELLSLGIGVTNAAYRTTPGSGDLRKADFAGSAERLERIALELAPRAIGFVGKEAYRGAFGERPELGLQERRRGETALFVLPSTSPANAAVPWDERDFMALVAQVFPEDVVADVAMLRTQGLVDGDLSRLNARLLPHGWQLESARDQGRIAGLARRRILPEALRKDELA